MTNTINEWNNNYCMTMTKTNKRCLNKCSNNDFCKKHMNDNNYYNELLTNIKKSDILQSNVNKQKLSGEILKLTSNTKTKTKLLKDTIDKYNSYLDNNFIHYLFDMYDSWSNVSPIFHVSVNNKIWDIRILVNHMAQQLNNTNMENPMPSYPSDPFNRELITPESITNIRNKIHKLQININIALQIFLFTTDLKINKIYNYAKNDKHEAAYQINKILSKKLRYRLINNKNSQNIFNGHWVLKNTQLSMFEMAYIQFRNTPYQIYVGHNIINNPKRDMILQIISELPTEDFNVNTDCLTKI